MKKGILLSLFFGLLTNCVAQSGDFSLGVRSTFSLFSDDGAGLGSGGQARIRFSNSLNTDWFADYIVVNSTYVRSSYAHIGWSVLYYPITQSRSAAAKWTPYIATGHCFDYNQKTLLTNQAQASRWGSAVQAGLGVHWHLSPKADLTLSSQYMIHLTKEIEVMGPLGGLPDALLVAKGTVFEGHLLSTISFNYQIGKLW
jgi:hypothetical protein